MSSIADRILAAGFACCIFASAPASAQTPPRPLERDGVAYITGGIGEDEVRAFRQTAPSYNLRISFASRSGQYLSDVDVTISSGERTVLGVRTDGPFLFVRVPAGRYRITARDRQIGEMRQVTVRGRQGVDVHFVWDDPDRHGVTRLCSNCPAPRRP